MDSAQDTMAAGVRTRYGPPEVVEIRTVPRPVPSGDQVLVRVRAASVNRADLDGLGPRPQFARLFYGLRAPRNPRIGLDVAGVVEAVGPLATRFRLGDQVFADMFTHGQGAFAEYVCARERAFAPMPAGASFEDAATLPHSAILALQGLRLRNGRTIAAGDRVLVDGASGNVGPFAVQIAKARGADVTGVASPGKLGFVESVGADHVIDYTTVDYTRAGRRYDWIVDVDSHHSMRDARRALRPRGVYVTLGGWDSRLLQAMLLGPAISLASRRSMGLMLWWKPFNADDVATISELVTSGRVRPAIDRRYPLQQLVEALRYLDEGRASGKVVITF